MNMTKPTHGAQNNTEYQNKICFKRENRVVLLFSNLMEC